jgi:transaldolase
MTDSIRSLIATGTKLYLDSVEPSEVDRNLTWGAVGATSNPAIISGIVKAGGLDSQIESLLADGLDDEAVAWALTDALVTDAQQKFQSIHPTVGMPAGSVSNWTRCWKTRRWACPMSNAPPSTSSQVSTGMPDTPIA